MRVKGFTLVELLVALLVMGILLQSGVYIGRSLVPHIYLISDTQQVLLLLSQARQQALMHHNILVCAANTDCSHFSQPTNGLKLIADLNQNAQQDTSDPILATTQLHTGTLISWHSFRNQPHLLYQQNGATYFQNGHLLICGRNEARKIVVNWIGRPYVEMEPNFSQRCH